MGDGIMKNNRNILIINNLPTNKHSKTRVIKNGFSSKLRSFLQFCFCVRILWT